MLSLDLVKTRLSVMSIEMRKNFIQVILTSLIEKSPDPKILRAVVKIVEEWVKNNSPMAANQVRRRLFSARQYRLFDSESILIYRKCVIMCANK